MKQGREPAVRAWILLRDAAAAAAVHIGHELKQR